MKTDKESIIAALKLWFRERDVFEIRVLDATTAEWMRPHMESGYFDYEHIPDAAEAIGKLRSFRGAYATVNPVNPDLLAAPATDFAASRGKPPPPTRIFCRAGGCWSTAIRSGCPVYRVQIPNTKPRCRWPARSGPGWPLPAGRSRSCSTPETGRR